MISPLTVAFPGGVPLIVLPFDDPIETEVILPPEPIVSKPLFHEGPRYLICCICQVPCKSDRDTPLEGAFTITPMLVPLPPVSVAVHIATVLPESMAHWKSVGSPVGGLVMVTDMRPVVGLMLMVPLTEYVEPSHSLPLPDQLPLLTVIAPLAHHGWGGLKESKS